MFRMKEELSPKAKEFKQTYERWFYGVPAGVIMAGFFWEWIPLFSIFLLMLAIYCLYRSQNNYNLYKAAKSEVRTAPTSTMLQLAAEPMYQGTKHCKQCGYQIASDSVFCEKCGKKLN